MPLLSTLSPLNLLEEKAKFLADQSYNPQFIYENFSGEEEALSSYGKPTKNYINLAEKIVTAAFAHKSERELLKEKGRELTQKEVTDKITLFLKMHGLKDRFGIIWSSSFIARTAITASTIKLRLPVSFREEDLLGMLYHEIGTHALRRINYEKQPWYLKKKKYGFGSYLRTEEGLAILHSLYPQKNKSAYSAALRYLAVAYAGQHSFAETFAYINQYIDDFDRCWLVTFRQKRGLEDTSLPGGFTKDLVYFEGFCQVWEYLSKHDFDITHLYFGKMALEDVEKAVKINPDFKPLLPSFFVTNQEGYRNKLNEVGEVNFLK